MAVTGSKHSTSHRALDLSDENLSLVNSSASNVQAPPCTIIGEVESTKNLPHFQNFHPPVMNHRDTSVTSSSLSSTLDESSLWSTNYDEISCSSTFSMNSTTHHSVPNKSGLHELPSKRAVVRVNCRSALSKIAINKTKNERELFLEKKSITFEKTVKLTLRF